MHKIKCSFASVTNNENVKMNFGNKGCVYVIVLVLLFNIFK